MTISTIANLEGGLSVRNKLNAIIGLVNDDMINPVEFGAVGDGSADDTAHLNTAIAAQNSTGRGIFLPPGKIFKITADLTPFTNGMVVVGGGTIKAPNTIRCLQHNATGWASGATERSATSLSVTAWQGEQNVTLVNLSNTSGFSIGQWVKIGSSTINTPTTPTAENNFWFEWAQIRAISTNTNITLDRYLEGHARGLLPNIHANYKLFGFPTTIRPVTVDVGFEADESASSILATNLVDRRVFLYDRGSINAHIRLRGRRWWQTIVVLHGILSEVDLAWEAIPDISHTSIPAANRVFGYGVLAHSGSFGCIARIRGGTCRHGFTTGVRNVVAYDPETPNDLGLSFHCGTSHDSIITGASASAYDTHLAFGARLSGHCAPSSEQENSAQFSMAVQDRGFNTTINVRVIGASHRNYQFLSALSDYSGLGENTTIVDLLESRDANASHHVTVQGVSSSTAYTLLLRNPTFTGPVTGSINAMSIQSGFAGRIVLQNPIYRDFKGRCIVDNSGLCRIEIHGGHVAWHEPTATPLPPFQVASSSDDRGDGTTGDWIIDGFFLHQATEVLPDGLFQIDPVFNVNIKLGRILSPIADVPIRSPSSTGGQALLGFLFDAGQRAPFANVSGSMATASSGRNWKLTGNVTAVPIANGWWGNLVNTSGANRSITPASGQCIVIESGATAGSVSIANNKGVHALGDDTNLLIFGDVV